MTVKNSDLRANKKPVDQDIQVPEAVRRAAAAADAAMLQLQARPAPQPAPNNDTITIVEPEPQRLPGQVPLTISAEPQPAPQPAPVEDANTWKNRYESMLGRFREASGQLQQANSRAEALENMLAATRSAAAPQPTFTSNQSYLTDKDKADMGEEMIDFVKRAAREEIAPLTSLQQELAKIKEQLSGTAQVVETNAREAMHNALTQALPNWQQVNHDQDFHSWLALRDPYSGAIRHKLLQEAYAQNDAVRVLSIFKGFVSETATLRPASPQPELAPAPVPPTRPTLEDLAAPGRARTAASPLAPAEKQFIRTSDVNAFYAAVRRGSYKGREELQKQHEQELFVAMQEGRVVQDT